LDPEGALLSQPSRGKTVLFGFLASLLILFSVEAAIRLFDSVRSDISQAGKPVAGDVSISSVFSQDVGWERRPGFKGRDVDGVVREFDSDGYFAIDSQKIAGRSRKKILFIGDSNTYGFGVTPSAAFPEVAGRLLPDVDAIDLGVNGYSSFQGSRILTRFLPRLKPAVVVASFNFDDRREIYEGDEPDSGEYFARIFRAGKNDVGKVSGGLDILHFYRLLRGGMSRVGLLRRPVLSFRIDRLRPRVDESEYRKNLASIAAQTRQLGIPLIFIVLRDNPLQAGYIDEAVTKLEASDFDAAIDYLTPVSQSASWFSDLACLYLSKAYAAKADRVHADRILVSTEQKRSIQGGRPIRIDAAYNQIMREVARENQVVVVEAAAELAKDPYVYIDFCHFNPLGHRRVAELLAPVLAKALYPTNPR
jgi:lysophospholipase L1-like esterase